MDALEINQNHRRAFASALRHVEKVLKDFIQLVTETGRHPHRKWTAGQTQEVLECIAAAQRQVDEFRAYFKIPASRPRDPSWAIQVGVAHLWEILEDCKSEPMRGYGEVPAATKPVMDAEVQKLIDVLQNIAAVARSEK